MVDFESKSDGKWLWNRTGMADAFLNPDEIDFDVRI